MLLDTHVQGAGTIAGDGISYAYEDTPPALAERNASAA